MDVIWHGIRDALQMAWEVWWALVLGFVISAIVQAWVPREQTERLLSGGGSRPIARATILGAASSSCSYAAVAIGKSLFQKGASAASALSFQFASTNLVWELGLVLWTLIGWQFTLAEYVGGVVMIILTAALLRLFVSPRLERQAREHALAAETGHQHHMAGEQLPLRQRLTSVSAWSDVAHNFRGDWQMLYREVGVGLVIAGFVAQINQHTFDSVFLTGSPAVVRTLWGAVIGPVIAVATFVCSVGNVPLAAVLWSGGISFAGVIAFIFADLIIIPIVAIYRKYYGTRFTVRIVTLMLLTMIAAALIVQAVFSIFGLIPSGPRPSTSDLFTGISLDYKFVLNAVATIVFAVLIGMTARRGATDPVCGMKVDRSKSVKSRAQHQTYHFCCDGCRDMFISDPDKYLSAKS